MEQLLKEYLDAKARYEVRVSQTKLNKPTAEKVFKRLKQRYGLRSTIDMRYL